MTILVASRFCYRQVLNWRDCKKFTAYWSAWLERARPMSPRFTLLLARLANARDTAKHTGRQSLPPARPGGRQPQRAAARKALARSRWSLNYRLWHRLIGRTEVTRWHGSMQR